MEKFFCLLFSVFVFAGCGGVVVYVDQDADLSVHEFNFEGTDYYFFHPDFSTVEGDRVVFPDEDDCVAVYFGDFDRIRGIAEGGEDFVRGAREERNLVDGSNEIWRIGDEKVLYLKSLKEKNLSFWAFDVSRDISACVNYVDEIFDSLKDKISQIRENYGFDFTLPEGFEPEYFEHGVFLKKNVGDYYVQMGVKSFENPTDYKSIGDYVYFEYSGYTIEALETENVHGFYVDEAIDEDAIRHFFTMSEDGSTIYEAYIKVPGRNFSDHLEIFGSVVYSFKIQ